jgi:hypothetical protein
MIIRRKGTYRGQERKGRRHKGGKLEEYEGREGGEHKKEKGEGIKQENNNTKEGNVQRTRKKREKA